MSEITDTELINEINNGNAQAFDILYERHKGRTYALCLRMMANTHDAEDMVQDVFIKVMSELQNFRGDCKFTTWLHRLTVNHVLMCFRGRATKKRTLDEKVFKQNILHSTSARRMKVLDEIAIGEMLPQLAPGYRKVLILHDVRGYEHLEIAKILKVSEGTSKSQLFKARRKAKELINKQKIFKVEVN